MRRFRFRFEAVERVRRARESEALRALAEAQGRYQEALSHKKNLVGQLSDALARRELLGSEPTRVMAFLTENDFISGTKQRIIQSDQAIVRATRGVEKALRSYLAAKRQLRVIETLRERHFSDFKRELAKREQKVLDDIYTTRAGRETLLSVSTEEEAAS